MLPAEAMCIVMLLHVRPLLCMQILSLYDRVMIWLDKANLGVCVQTNSWTAAALQLAIQFYKVLP